MKFQKQKATERSPWPLVYGIIIFYGKKKGELAWIRPNGDIMSKRDISLHMENILEGRYSMGTNKDTIILEERVETDPLFDSASSVKEFNLRGVR